MPDQPSRERRSGSDKVDYEALAEFRYQLRKYLRFSENVTHQQGVTPLQYLLLLQIKGYPGRTWASVAELAERLQAQHHGVVALVSRCEALGLVQRIASTTDLRKVEVHLTEAGDTLVTNLVRLHRAELVALQGRFTVPDLAATEAALPAPRRRRGPPATTAR
jgi:DNA-binding MarR family transcriptional regulator